jgi:heat shock protein HslJ
MIYKLLIALFLTQMISCENDKIDAQSEITGEWTLKNVFLSDAYDSPCGWEAGEHEPLTMNVVYKDEKYAISGKSAVNSYFGSFEILTYNQDTKIGTVKTGAIGSTKMAGPPLLMNCEQRFLDQLQNATDFGFDENGELRVGNFRNENSHPRDGGYYLVFERSK